jgi:hypothetical protein
MMVNVIVMGREINENGQRSEVSKWKTTGLTPLIGHLIWKH